VAIRILIADENVRVVRFAVSPLSEAALSLNALIFPHERPVQHPWIRAMRDLPAPLRREIRAFGFALDYAIPDCLLPARQRSLVVDWKPALAELARMEPERAAYEITRPAFHYALDDPEGENLLQRDDVQRKLRERARRYGAGSLALVRLAIDNPTELRDRFVAMLDDYWEAAFCETWATLEQRLVAVARNDARKVALQGVYSILDARFADTVVDKQQGWLLRQSPHAHDVRPTRERQLTFIPSFFVWPHVRVNCDEPWPLAAIYPPSDVLEEARAAQPPPELIELLQAVADPTRLRIVRALVQRPRPTEELAPLVGLTAGATSRHLGVLRAAGLVERKREGYYVIYRVVPERMPAVGAALRDFLTL
jgi:DNA-binding transcriptional ArsR family regulator